MSGVEGNVPFYFNGDFGTGDTSKRWIAEGNCKNEIAFYQSIFSGEPVIRFDSEEKIRSAYEALAAGGKIVKPLMEAPIGGLFAAVTDRNGIGWNLQYDRG
ncbi:VOC family protein [Paenibacillus sp. R14(2021)]|uniref:VOC family protein n=1 Tax=Paenibacillus sp. R14(2021) TaxID=2859228 RepID=UPI002157A583|nr:VOC family protein [Paenibacillus sp. R14(2021)]